MTTTSNLPVFQPSVDPDLPFEQRLEGLESRIVRMADNSIEAHADVLRDRREFQARWSVLTLEQKDEIVSFFQGFRAAAAFRWTLPDGVSVISPTGQAPILSSGSGGSLGARSYDVGFTFFQSGDQSRVSKSATIAVPANELLTVTLPSAVPARCDGWRVFAGTSGGSLTAQASVTDATSWTEPTTGLIVGSGAPASSSLAVEKVFLRNGPVTFGYDGPVTYYVSVPLIELAV